MSSTGQWVGAIAGGVIGFVIAGPMGAVKGAAYGAALGGYIDPPAGPNLRGPTLDDKSFQSSAYGVGIPAIYGTIATMGNIIYLENNEYKAVSKKETQGGKGGGGGATVETTTYFATFAVALGEASPGALVRRVWAGGKLIYSTGASDLETMLQSFSLSASGAPKFKFYDGTQTEPDSRMESVLGVGNCPSYEGTMYIIFYDFDLTDYGNGLAGCPIKVEISAGDKTERALLTYDTLSSTNLRVCSGLFYRGDLFYCFPRLWPGFFESQPSISGKITSNNFVFGSDSLPDYSGFDTGTWARIIGGINTQSKAWIQYLRTSIVGGDRYFCAYSPDLGEIRFLKTADWYLQGIGAVVHLPQGLGFSCFRQKEFAGPDSVKQNFIYSGGYFLPVSKFAMCAFGFMEDGRLITVDDDSDATGVISRKIKIFERYDGWFLQETYFANLPYLDCRAAVFNIGNSIYIFDYPDTDGVSFWVFDIGLNDIVRSGFVEFGTTISSAGYDGSEARHLWGYKNGVFGLTAPMVGPSLERWIRYVYFTLDAVDPEGAPLSGIVEKIFNERGVDSFDVSDLGGNGVMGYRTDGIVSGRGALSALQAAYLFDIIENGYVLECVRRHVVSVADIPYQNLIFSNDKSAVSVEREQESRLHSHYEISYIDFNREYDSSVQVSEYPSINYSQRQEQIPVVMTADFAAQTADILHGLEWLERESFSFSLPQPYLFLKVSDVVRVEIRPGVWRLMRISATDKSAAQVIGIEARASAYDAYSSAAAGADVDPPSETIPLIGSSYCLLLDIPMILEQQQNTFGFVAASYGDGNTWPGCVLMESIDSGQTYSALNAFYGKSTIASATNILAASDGLIIERGTSLQASIVSGEFSSITEDQMMRGAHYCAYGNDGRWEIIQYAGVSVVSEGVISFSTFVRGLFGTEWASSLHQAGDKIILLSDPDNAFVGRSALNVGLGSQYKAVTVSASVSEVDPFSFTYNAVNLRPLSVVNVTGSRNIDGDIDVAFVARTRYSSNFWITGVQPLNEPTIAFEVDVMNGSSVVRTISTASQSFTYTAIEQTEDFGSPQSAISFRIYQISAAVGRGYARAITL